MTHYEILPLDQHKRDEIVLYCLKEKNITLTQNSSDNPRIRLIARDQDGLPKYISERAKSILQVPQDQRNS
ncbi:MAG TPA: hypothetical protein VJK51_00415 [Candidatus Nanoarchaeia archaeon]|nr:hypothetical protein [Candidatus Nanoarchaeia archaeon]